MKKLVLAVAVIAAIYFGRGELDWTGDSADSTGQIGNALASAIDEQKSGVQTEGDGIVVKILPDDNDGSRHQRFLLRLHFCQTVLIAHNIDIAPRISSLREGDVVAFNGEYEWNSKGGVIHWTHHDPSNRHVTGWLKHNDQTYQ